MFATISNTAGILAKDINTFHDVFDSSKWHRPEDAAQCCLDRFMEIDSPSFDGSSNPQLISALYHGIDNGDWEETVLVFITIDDEGYVVTWQVTSI